MKIELKSAKFTSALFIGGTNLGETLPGLKNLKFYYDTDLDHVVIIHNKDVGLAKAHSMTVKDPKVVGVTIEEPQPRVVRQVSAPVPSAVKAQVSGPERVIVKAQVETPHDKVQGKPGRKVKYQGEESQGE